MTPKIIILAIVLTSFTTLIASADNATSSTTTPTTGVSKTDPCAGKTDQTVKAGQKSGGTEKKVDSTTSDSGNK